MRAGTRCLGFVAVVVLAPWVRGMQPTAPRPVIVESGTLRLHALVYRPVGEGSFPAVLFNHGSYGRGDVLTPDQPDALGTVFTRHGYVLLFLFRRGVGLSADQGKPEGVVMNEAFAAGGSQARNRTQVALLEGEAMEEALAGLAVLKGSPAVDPQRIALAGHSFGGSLSLLVAARESAIRAVALFASTARSWDRSADLRVRLRTAARTIKAPVLFMHAANDYSTAPGRVLGAERQGLGLPQRLQIYASFGSTPSEGHNFLYSSVATWESDVFAFLDESLSSAKPIAHVSPP